MSHDHGSRKLNGNRCRCRNRRPGYDYDNEKLESSVKMPRPKKTPKDSAFP
jgi:hypothetical protein